MEIKTYTAPHKTDSMTALDDCNTCQVKDDYFILNE